MAMEPPLTAATSVPQSTAPPSNDHDIESWNLRRARSPEQGERRGLAAASSVNSSPWSISRALRLICAPNLLEVYESWLAFAEAFGTDVWMLPVGALLPPDFTEGDASVWLPSSTHPSAAPGSATSSSASRRALVPTSCGRVWRTRRVFWVDRKAGRARGPAPIQHAAARLPRRSASYFSFLAVRQLPRVIARRTASPRANVRAAIAARRASLIGHAPTRTRSVVPVGNSLCCSGNQPPNCARSSCPSGRTPCRSPSG